MSSPPHAKAAASSAEDLRLRAAYLSMVDPHAAGVAPGDRSQAWFKVASDSMKPYLMSNDEVWITPVHRAPRWGTVVAFVREGCLWVHRCRGPAGTGAVWTRGDTRPVPDAPVPLESIVGVVRGVRRGGRQTPLREDALRAAWSVVRGTLWTLKYNLRRSFGPDRVFDVENIAP